MFVCVHAHNCCVPPLSGSRPLCLNVSECVKLSLNESLCYHTFLLHTGGEVQELWSGREP